MLLLREKLFEQQRTHELSKLDKEAVNKYRRHGQGLGRGQGHVQVTQLSDKERERSTDLEKSTDDLELDPNDLDDVLGGGSLPADRSMALIVKCLRLMMLNCRNARFNTATVRLMIRLHTDN